MIAASPTETPAASAPATEKWPHVRHLELGLFNGCALYEDGRVACWGIERGKPALVTELPPVDRLHVGNRFACARATKDHALYCWGDNQHGQLGRRTKSKYTESLAQAVVDRAQSPLVVEDFLVGSGHMCLLVPNGDVSCFGSSISGEAGLRPAHDQKGGWVDVVEPKVVFRGARRVYGGGSTSCAVDAQEKLYCWGSQDAGYNGHGDTFAPKRIATPGVVRAMSFGSGHSCILIDDGSVHCRGWNPGGQLGSAGRPQKAMDGRGAFDADFEPQFVRLQELTKRYTAISASRHETCAVSSGGDVTCIGTPDWGPRGTCSFLEAPAPPSYRPPKARPFQRGSSSLTSAPPSPARFTQARCEAKPEPGLAAVLAVAATMGQRCTVQRDGRVRCIGGSSQGRPTAPEPVPLELPE